MSVQIKINNFEGPFDLLFHLIEKNEVDIYDIPIAEITNQYLEYINGMKKLNLEVASEFIVMASTLLMIKSKLLLPQRSDDSDLDPDADPRAELVEQLLQYKKYKDAAQVLRDGEKRSINIYYKNAEIIDDIEEDKLLLDTTLDDLVRAFNDIMKRHSQNDPGRETDHEIEREEITVDQSMDRIREMLGRSGDVYFEDLFPSSCGKLEIIITFLALLELANIREVAVTQMHPYGKILIERIYTEVRQ